MARKSETELRELSAHLAELAGDDPEAAVGQLSKLPELLVADDRQTRVNSSIVLVQLSEFAPLRLRSTSEAILARLDDTEPNVRHNITLTIANLSQWYPQDFADGSNLMVAALSSDVEAERIGAATALTQLSYYRPDLVTPRQQALDRLREVRERDNLDDHEDFLPTAEKLDGAIQALEGGDMASRPLEDDLVPIGKHAPLSKPARVGISAILWVPLLFASMLLFIWSLIRLRWRMRKVTNSGWGRLAVLAGESVKKLTHITMLTPLPRGRLYVWQSPIATATRLLPGGTTPTKEDYAASVPPYPDDWGTLAALVRQRDGHQCRNCGALGGPRDGDAELHVDHQVPRSCGGADHPSNLRTLCRGCHEARHGRRFSDE